MAKVTLDRDAFKALASDTRLDILRSLDGRKMTVTELSSQTKMNKATLHEHLLKLQTVGLVKRIERDGHKWVYYKLSWKGSSLLHPENNRIVVMFSATVLALIAGITSIITHIKNVNPILCANDDGMFRAVPNAMEDTLESGPPLAQKLGVSQPPYFLYLAIICIIAFIILFIVSYHRYTINKKPKI